MREQVVILAVKYDETETAPPSQWDWSELADASVEVLLTGVIVKGDE